MSEQNWNKDAGAHYNDQMEFICVECPTFTALYVSYSPHHVQSCVSTALYNSITQYITIFQIARVFYYLSYHSHMCSLCNLCHSIWHFLLIGSITHLLSKKINIQT